MSIVNVSTVVCVIVIVSTSTLSVDAKWDLEKILSLCDDDSCDVSKDVQMSKYSDARYHQRLAHYVTGGVSDILWSHVRQQLVGANTSAMTSNNKNDVKMSKSCINNLKMVINDANKGRKWAFEMMASTGKTPELLSRSTLTSLGDYDTCLSVDNLESSAESAVRGKYCLVDMFPMKFADRSKDGHQFSLDMITIFKYFPFKTGVCIPNSCSGDDLRHLLVDAMKSYPLIVKGDLNCDTQESISWTSRINNLNAHQIISLIFLLSVVSITSFATYYHVIAKYIFNDVSVDGNDLLMCLSCWQNMTKLATKSNDKNSRFLIIDTLKLFTVLAAVLGHFLAVVEIPNGYLMLDRHSNMNLIFSKGITQLLMNENGMTIFAFLGGFLTFVSIFPLAKEGNISYISIILMRYVHFVPSLLCLMAAEFVWTFLFSGPFYTKVSSFVLQKCSKNWWRNLLFIQNLYPSLEACVGHTFSLATDFQCFLYGLLAIYLIAKNRKLGLAFISLASVISFGVLSYRAIKYETSGTIYTPNPTPIKIVEYLQFIYMTTEAHIPSYMIGFYVGYKYDSGYRFKVDTLYDHVKVGVVAATLQVMVSVINGLKNEFNLIPQSLTFLQIVSNRTFFTASIAIYMMYFLSMDAIFGFKLDKIESSYVKQKRDANNNITSIDGPEETPQTGTDAVQEAGSSDKKNVVEYSFFTALCRLSYAIYLSNYLLVKYEFFTSRSLLSLDWYPLAKRLTGSIFFCLIFAFTFYCFFIAPFDALNKRYLFNRRSKKSSESTADKKKNI